MHLLGERMDDEPAGGTIPDAVEAAERRRDVKHAILGLSPDYREVIVLRHFAALSYEEMSDAIGVPAKTVKSRLHSARQQLAAELAGWMRERGRRPTNSRKR
jgi:RNA polymerase sigma-70 factor (ECF subfamily)